MLYIIVLWLLGSLVGVGVRVRRIDEGFFMFFVGS